jgi:hypothetical protein
VEATLHPTPPAATHWTARTLARAQVLSRMTVHRIWRQHGLQPHRVETFTLSRDLHFVDKVRDVVGLYGPKPDASSPRPPRLVPSLHFTVGRRVT